MKREGELYEGCTGHPNWNLVTDTYIEPNNFAELFSLLVPCHPKGEGKNELY